MELIARQESHLDVYPIPSSDNRLSSLRIQRGVFGLPHDQQRGETQRSGYEHIEADRAHAVLGRPSPLDRLSVEVASLRRGLAIPVNSLSGRTQSIGFLGWAS